MKSLDWPDLIQEEKFTYDTSVYDFKSCFEAIMECESLAYQHEKPLTEFDSIPLCPSVYEAYIRTERLKGGACLVGRGNHCIITQHRYRRNFQTSAQYQQLLKVYHNFIVDVIHPMVQDPMGLIYQTDPILRCHMPGTRPSGKPHRDADYFHQKHELNFWIPITNVWGSNSLMVESECDKGDFHALCGGYGDAFRFYGNQCYHYTMANDTSSTRVSFDFRIIPRSLYVERTSEEQKKSHTNLQIGGYYSKYVP